MLHVPRGGGVPVADPYWSSVVLLLDASRYAAGLTPATLDITGKAATWRGNAQCSTAQAKFGDSSLYFDGTNDRISFADSADWAMGTGDATWEAWIRPEGSFSGGQRFFLGQASSTGAFYSALLRRNTSDQFQAGVSNGTTTYEASSSALVSDTWVHVALVRAGALLYSYAAGYRTVITGGIGSTVLMDSTGAMTVGGYADEDHATNWKGWLDQVRVTKGVARYTTETIPVPVTPFPHY
ncbi:MAG: LamG domain-containing protein [Burkholderiaceae bacterium]|nr:LamG domain-containing protein [Burkholderiaceae bacterium]